MEQAKPRAVSSNSKDCSIVVSSPAIRHSIEIWTRLDQRTKRVTSSKKTGRAEACSIGCNFEIRADAATASGISHSIKGRAGLDQRTVGPIRTVSKRMEQTKSQAVSSNFEDCAVVV